MSAAASMLLDTFPALLAAASAASRAKLCIDPAIYIHSLWRGKIQPLSCLLTMVSKHGNNVANQD